MCLEKDQFQWQVIITDKFPYLQNYLYLTLFMISSELYFMD